nr:unnamed protein product [Naegleria fowleri]
MIPNTNFFFGSSNVNPNNVNDMVNQHHQQNTTTTTTSTNPEYEVRNFSSPHIGSQQQQLQRPPPTMPMSLSLGQYQQGFHQQAPSSSFIRINPNTTTTTIISNNTNFNNNASTQYSVTNLFSVPSSSISQQQQFSQPHFLTNSQTPQNHPSMTTIMTQPQMNEIINLPINSHPHSTLSPQIRQPILPPPPSLNIQQQYQHPSVNATGQTSILDSSSTVRASDLLVASKIDQFCSPFSSISPQSLNATSSSISSTSSSSSGSSSSWPSTLQDPNFTKNVLNVTQGKHETSCLLCKIRHRKCDYCYPFCTHCSKEGRTFCLYLQGKKTSKQQEEQDLKNDMFVVTGDEEDNISKNITRENMDTIYKNVHNNISGIKCGPEITSKLSYSLAMKLMGKILPVAERDLLSQLLKVSLAPQNEKFVGNLEYFYKYFNTLEDTDRAMMYILQCLCLQRIGEKKLGREQFEKARSKMSTIFDHVSNFKLVSVYALVVAYLVGEGEKQKAEYYLNHVKFYVKEFQPTSENAHYLLRTALFSESFLQSNNYDQLLTHFENILVFFTPKEAASYSLSEDAAETVSKYVASSNEQIFSAKEPKTPNPEKAQLKKQLAELKHFVDKNKQEYPIGFHQLFDSLSTSSEGSEHDDEFNDSQQEEPNENVEKKIKQINIAIENIKAIFGTTDYIGNMFMTFLYSIVILRKHRSFKGEISLEAIKYADLISKTTQCEDFIYSSFPCSVPISLACKVHLQSLKNILNNSTSLIIAEYAEKLITYLNMDYNALKMLANRFQLVDQKYNKLLLETLATLENFQQMKENDPTRFISLQHLSQYMNVF